MKPGRSCTFNIVVESSELYNNVVPFQACNYGTHMEDL